ncbi:inositol monophosphatase family protein [Halococcoides cellulosivorans]|uniref:fructose-bisphosphatase n=1 Tax=Halococcoides cellulosivorans TaxID=1679096 RepID=A0A2R4X1E4_9EURY|nr:inositol monophosphatase [Halococcoides cellulosivorans]AWB27618.1 inositol monophosphatase [Halococcoides cellulosivorans]
MTDATRRAAMTERAARAGGAVAREAFRGAYETETKDGKNDLVTTADHESQRQIVATVTEEFTDEPFVCEESPDGPAAPTPAVIDTDPVPAPDRLEAVPETGPAWVVDPIDGTNNFVRGLPTWTTSVASVVDGEVVAAATYQPTTGDSFTVGPDSATRDGTALAVSERTDPEAFTVALTGLYGSDPAMIGGLVEQSGEVFGDFRRLGSMQATLAAVADGGLDGCLTPHDTNPWDTMAGVAMVRAAGGAVTDVTGEPWTPEATGLIASNGAAHDRFVAVAEQAIQIGPEA